MGDVIDFRARAQRADRVTPRSRVSRRPRGVRGWYSVPEAAAIFRISTKTMYKCVKNGDIPAMRLGRRIVIPVHAVERMIRGE
jgi:excisionase family DNA binding protein